MWYCVLEAALQGSVLVLAGAGMFEVRVEKMQGSEQDLHKLVQYNLHLRTGSPPGTSHQVNK
jgi:hypothetical protein